MVTIICKSCGKEFQVCDNRKDSAKYCSASCQHKSLLGTLNCKCEICGKPLHRKPCELLRNKHVTCSKECLNKLKSIIYSGEGNHQWGLKGDLNSSFKGIEIPNKNNNLTDVLVYAPTHPRADRNGRVLKHRLLVEENYKQFDSKYFEEVNGQIILKRTTQIHHINLNHNDNRIENLMPVTRSEHRTIHNMNITFTRDKITGRITGVLKQGELLEKPAEVDQQPSLYGDILEGSETNSRVLRDSNTNTSALPKSISDDIVRSIDITK